MKGINFKEEFFSTRSFRQKLEELVRLELHGPLETDDESIKSRSLAKSPTELFSCGMLFPQEIEHDIGQPELRNETQWDSEDNKTDQEILAELREFDEIQQEKTKGQQKQQAISEIEGVSDDIDLTNQRQPSSIGISFVTEKRSELDIRVYFAKYFRKQKDTTNDKVEGIIADNYGLDLILEKFQKWLSSKELAEKTIKNYRNALQTICSDLEERKLNASKPSNLSHILTFDLKELEPLFVHYFSIAEVKAKDERGNHMYSAAAKHFVNFVKSSGEIYLKETEGITRSIAPEPKTTSIEDQNEKGRPENREQVFLREEVIKEHHLNLSEEKKRFGYVEFPEHRVKICWKIRSAKHDQNSISVWLINQEKMDSEISLYKNTLFQAKIEVETSKGNILPIRKLGNASGDLDSRSNALLYRDKHNYCRGHGCSGDWISVDDKKCSKVFSNLIPSYEMKKIIPAEDHQLGRDIDFTFLGNSRINQGNNSVLTICKNLDQFVDAYDTWIDGLAKQIDTIPEDLQETAKTHLKNCRSASKRMSSGIRLLESNPKLFFAFRLANHAMLLQQMHGSLKSRTNSGEFVKPTIEDNSKRKWRPFQLAFILLNIDSLPIGDKFDSENSKLVDLIWFPTGGGKTEAYLGVAALAIIYSRLVDPDFKGTEIIMRYTLRLLTTQQFQRACYLILALERIRVEGLFGEDEITNSSNKFSAGLWVGANLTPNRIKDAGKALKKMKLDSWYRNPFTVLECPWCKTDLTEHNYRGYKYSSINAKFEFNCPERQCEIYGAPLPITVIDEQLYETLPTLLLGTVDKFAQLAWLEAPAKFFGKGSKKPPSVIIQDELHLISGPLGSVVGHYEYLIRTIIKQFGPQPKIIASTATIRRAKDQVFGLYRAEVKTFPPQGISYDDSFFAREAKDIIEDPGRLYVGIFANATKSIQTAQTRLVSPLSQFPVAFFEKDLEEGEVTEDGKPGRMVLPHDSYNEFIDPYGTLIWYFNTLRELGYADTLLIEDINQFGKNLCSRYGISYVLRKGTFRKQEMTSRAKEDEIGKILKDLDVKWGPKQYDSIDTLLATNMISVGVDIDRLGLMVVNGQPKSTSEYIQASSRVGRKHPGVVFTLYNHTRTRDRSHFETFKAYHQAIYRHVEPTSITPFSFKSRQRALPGLILGIARACCNMSKANEIIGREEEIKSYLHEYFLTIDELNISDDEVEIAKEQVEEIIDKWKILSLRKDSEGESLAWGNMTGTEENALLFPYGKTFSIDDYPIEPLKMLTSMRNVDAPASVDVVPFDQEEAL